LILDIKLLKNLWYDIVWKGLNIKESIEEIADLYFIHLGTRILQWKYWRMCFTRIREPNLSLTTR